MLPSGAKMVIAVLVGVAALASLSIFTVTETQQVVITQFGEPVGKPITEAGLKFKLPWQAANYFEKRVLKWDGRPNQIPTKDKKYIWVDTTARWRIADPLLFMQRVVTIPSANGRLDGIIDSVVRNHVSNNDLVELVRSEGWAQAKQKLWEAGLSEIGIKEAKEPSEVSEQLLKGREKITREMVSDAAGELKDLGIALLDIRIKRINYVDSVQQKVFERMISERKRIAAQYRSEGEGERAAVLGQMERELAKINSEAYRKSQEIRGKADAETTRIYAEGYGKNPEFFGLYKTLELYRNFTGNSSFMLTTDAEIFKYLKSSGEPQKK